MNQQITIKNLDQPKRSDLDEDIYWLCESLGLNQGRDIDNTSSRLINILLKKIVNKGNVSVKSLAENLGIESQRVNYHLRAITNSGLLYRESKHIHLRQGSVKSAIEEMRSDANRIFDNISKIAEEIDDSLGLKNR